MRSSPIDIRNREPYDVDQFCLKSEYETDVDRILISEGEIENRIDSLARDISREYRDRSGDSVYVACLLKGAIRFFSALTPRLEFEGPSSEGIIRASRYSEGVPDSTDVDISFLEEDMIEGKDVLIVEDLIDEGYTLEGVVSRIEQYDPNSIDVTVLFDKVARRQTDVDVAFTGFDIPDSFVVGYGLDYDERYRGLRHLAVLDESAR